MTDELAQLDSLPQICGHDERIAQATSGQGAVYLPESGIDFAKLNSAFAIALHMHQPLIPGGGDDVRTAEVIGHLQFMAEHPDIGDGHNAPVFRWCYKRMGEFIPKLVEEGKNPRVMLEYSGCLLQGLLQMGAMDVIDALRVITADRNYRRCVEWLGAPWGHAVAPSTPVQDYRLHVRAWQHFFASIFGLEALSRIRGFSPSEMALPNHPDVCYEFVRTLKDCGFTWLLVQEHTIERPADGGGIERPHQPHRLVARNSKGQTISITAIVKTQGSDTKLVAQMQPYYEACGLSRVELAGKSIPPLVTQIADGENGGVMMNEFPSKYQEVMSNASGSATAPVNVTEYLEYLESIGVRPEDFTPVQPIKQKMIWDNFKDGAGAEEMEKTIEKLRHQRHDFHMEGGSWTNNISWVRGYDSVIGPIEKTSALFAQKVLENGVPTTDPRYRNALYHLLMTQISCYRYWGQGRWTDYAQELCRRTQDILQHDF